MFSAENNENANRFETVRLQLKGLHSFQFAGYYAAKERGYYAEEGLDVHILEQNPNIDIVKQVVSGQVEYGIGDIGILLQYANGSPIKALAAIFQQTPLIFTSRQITKTSSPLKMADKRIIFFGGKEPVTANDNTIESLLNAAKITQEKYTLVPQPFQYWNLFDKKIDLVLSHLPEQSTIYRSNDETIKILNPDNRGYEHYGELLFTSQTELTDHPNRADRFKRATLQGWQYALDHPEEIIQLISSKYDSQSTIDQLRFEAEETRNLILPEIIPLGKIEEKRLRLTANIYENINILRHMDDDELASFVSTFPKKIRLTAKEKTWLKQHPVIQFGIDRHFAPYEWLDNGNLTGITTEYIRLLEQRLGIRFELIKGEKNWPEVLNAAKENKLDVLFSLIKTDDRSTYLNFTQPYFTSTVAIISGQAHGYIGSLKRLSNKRVAIQKGHSTEELLSKNYPEISVVTADSIKEALQMVEDGDAHAYVGDVTSAGYIIKKEDFSDLMFSGQSEYQSEFRIGIPKSNPLLLSIIKKALANISQDENNEIYNHWQELRHIKTDNSKALIKYGFITLVIILLFAYWVHKLRKSESALRRSESKLKAMFDAEPECIKVTSKTGQLLQINPAGLKIIEAQKNPSTIIGKHVEDLIVPEHRQAFREMKEKVEKGQQEKLVLQIESLKGCRRWMETHAVPLVDPTSGESTILMVSRDISDKKLAYEKIWQHANFDSLTNLPNRRMFQDYLKHEIKISHRNNYLFALLFLDLDRFKEVNDELGHHVGDVLLSEVAKRIMICVREADTVSRLSGDEFTIILSELEDKQEAERIAEKIIKTLSNPFYLGNEIAYISVSIGIAIYPIDATTGENLLKNADQAMYSAKRAGRNRFSYFTKTMQDEADYRLQLTKDLHSALPEKQFQLFYQPIIELSSGKIQKVEALLRWFHPERGMVSPSEFIPFAEESGLIVEIGDWVLKESIKQLKYWQQTFNTGIQISINKSPIQYNITHHHYDWIHLLDEYEVKGESIVIEITESLLMDDSDTVTARFLQYRDAGIQIAIDDFGTGYSALAYLNRYDIDYVKIDQSFILNLAANPNNSALIEAMSVMAHKLGLKVIVEGVETNEHLELLNKAECDYGQGYLFDKPMAAKQLEQKYFSTKRLNTSLIEDRV